MFGGHTAWREGKQDVEKVHDDVWALDLQTWQVICAWAGHFWESSIASRLVCNPPALLQTMCCSILARYVTCVSQCTR